MRQQQLTIDPALAAEAKSIVALAFRNGPIEEVHAGKLCPTCAGRPEYSRITQDEMKRIMRNAVDKVYTLLYLKSHDPKEYAARLALGNLHTAAWDDPNLKRPAQIGAF